MANAPRPIMRNPTTTPDQFFDLGDDNDVLPNLTSTTKKRPFLMGATSWLKRDEKKTDVSPPATTEVPFSPAPPTDTTAAWLSRDEQTGSIRFSAGRPGAYTANSTHSGFLRISAPVPIHENEMDNGRSKAPSPPRVLGMGAEVVRTPMEALDGLRSPTEPAAPAPAPTLSRASRTRSSPHLKQRSNSSLPPIPSSPQLLRPSFRTSSTEPIEQPALPPLPKFRPISTFEAAGSFLPSPPKTASPTKSVSSSKKLSVEPAVSEPPMTAFSTSFVLPPPPFVPVLVNAPPENPSSLEADQQIIALETASSTLTTTLATLTATQSHLSAYLEPMFAARDASVRAPSPAHEPSPPTSPKTPFSAAFAAHQRSLGLFGGRPSSPISIYPAETDPDSDDGSEADVELAARIALPPSGAVTVLEIEEEILAPSSSRTSKSSTPTAPRGSTSPSRMPGSSTAPLRTPIRRTHLFLDRPSAPYIHILAFLRSLASTTTPILPRTLAQMPASSAVRMDALIEVRDEAMYLGMELLVSVCEDEIARRRGERAKKMSVLKLKEKISSSEMKIKDRSSISSGHETAVEEVDQSGSSRPGSVWDTKARESYAMPPINSVSAHRSTPAPAPSSYPVPHHASSASLSSPISSSPKHDGLASQLRSSLSSKPSQATVRPSHPPTVHSLSFSPGHSRFPQSVESFASSLGADADVESEMGVVNSHSIDVRPKPGQLASRRDRSGSRGAMTGRGRKESDVRV